MNCVGGGGWDMEGVAEASSFFWYFRGRSFSS